MFPNGCRSCSPRSFQPRTLIHTIQRISGKAVESSTYPYDRKPASSSASHPALSVRHFLTSRGHLHLGRSFTPTSITSGSQFSPPYTPQRAFSSTPFAMTATKIDGTAIAKSIRERLHAEIEATQKVNPRYKPSLKIIQGIYCTQSCTQSRPHIVC